MTPRRRPVEPGPERFPGRGPEVPSWGSLGPLATCLGHLPGAFLLVTALLALSLAAPGPAAGQDGPAVVLPQADAIRAAEEIRDARALAAVVETLKAEAAAKDEAIRALDAQVAAFRAEAAARAAAMAVAEDRERRRADDDARVAKALDRAEQALVRADRALDRAEARIEALERRAFWLSILGPIGAVLGLAAGAF